jgi:hypothetical protein
LKLLLVGLALFPLIYASQEQPSDAPIPKQHEGDRFIGEWKLNTKKSSRVAIESETIKIETIGREYRFEHDQASENGAVLHWWFVTDMKGECVKQTQKNGEPMFGQSCVLRLDGNRFVDKTLLAKYEYKVDRDGQRMTVHRTLLPGRNIKLSRILSA